MAGTPPKLQWYKIGSQLNGGCGKDGDFPALFYIKTSEFDGSLRVHTSLPGNFRAGAFGHAVDSVEQGQAYAEEVLRDFYRALKKHMEPKKAPAKADGKGGNK